MIRKRPATLSLQGFSRIVNLTVTSLLETICSIQHRKNNYKRPVLHCIPAFEFFRSPPTLFFLRLCPFDSAWSPCFLGTSTHFLMNRRSCQQTYTTWFLIIVNGLEQCASDVPFYGRRILYLLQPCSDFFLYIF